MSVPIFQIDAFTDRAFGGNPACVCFMEDAKGDDWLQAVATEMNLSETAFVWERGDHFHLRWFTPVSEVKLCGHATLATAYALWEQGRIASDEDAVFETLSGQLRATRLESEIILDFPAKELTQVPAPDGMLESLGVESNCIMTDGIDYMVVVSSQSTVENVNPDFHRLAQVEARGVIVTSRASSADYDFISRFFAPAFGIHEDPVTGSAHCLLAPYWADELQVVKMRAFQASKRGGALNINLSGDRVKLGGKASMVFSGTLLV